MENGRKEACSCERPKKCGKARGIASMILGIAGVVGIGGNAAGIAASVVGFCLAREALDGGDDSGFAQAGKITSLVGLGLRAASALLALAVVMFFCVFAAAAVLSEGMAYWYGFEVFDALEALFVC
ncbi:MAG: hypothetical protein PUA83_02795 [Clostridiales bacterium]|nr:hypothetical protein [Clostridiales bacterium]